MKVKKTERGWAGHFICSHYCRFRRNTLIEYGDKRWIVSTVGNMVSPPIYEILPIGELYRYYETMAFEAKMQDGYWEANVKKEIPFNSRWAILKKLADDEANKMHEAVVKELSKKIIQ